MLRHLAKRVSTVKQSSRAYCSNSRQILDRDTKIKQRDRTALLDNSKDFDYLREEIAKSLLDRLDDVLDREFPVAADLGSLTGVNLKHIQDKGGIKKLFHVELSEKMLRRDEKDDSKYEIKPIRVVGDEEFVPFKAKSLDLIYSNLSLHWVNDLPGSLIQIRHTLKEDGLFLAAMLGENTLIELRNSFYLAEQEREGGLSPHVSPFAGVADMGNLLTRAGFALPTVDTESLTIRYKDPWVLFSDLRAMGESNAIMKRRVSTPPSTLMAAAAAYQAMYGAADGSIPATFQVVYMIGWAPSKSQPQPKKRGSATHSLKDIENITTGGCRDKDLSNK